MMEDILESRLRRALEKFTKWRMVFAGWQLGTRPKDDPECQAVRDHREVTMLMRAELNAMTGLLFKKGIFTTFEFQQQMLEELDHLDAQYQRKFPGFKTADDGVDMDLAQVRDTMKDWRP